MKMYPLGCHPWALKRMNEEGCTKCSTAMMAVVVIEMVVAQAAPAMPKCIPKMKMGSKIIFSTAPPTIMNIDFIG